MEKRKINASELVVGAKYTENLYFDDGKNIFLPVGFAITQKLLSVLEKWNIPYVLTEGVCVSSQMSNYEEILRLANMEEVEASS